MRYRVLPLAALVALFCRLVLLLQSNHPQGHDISQAQLRTGNAERHEFRAMADLVEPYGYSLQRHQVATSDGYLLGLFRVTLPSARRRSGTATPVLLQHALMDSSAGWIILGPGRSLALLLADAGYDVWLGNARGNRYSRRHTFLDPDTDPAFWEFSFDHIAAFDLPAVISHVLRVTRQPRLAYVGYSQGATSALAALSSQPEAASKVSLAVLLAPVVFATHIRSLPFLLGSSLRLDKLVRLLGWHEYASHSPRFARLSTAFCSRVPWACVAYLTALCGRNPASSHSNLDLALLSRLFHHLPSGTSLQTMSHWSQALQQPEPATLSHFDWGTRCTSADGAPQPCNQLRYGQEAAPRYNLSAITTPLAVFGGGSDTISTPEDVARLLRTLPLGLPVHHYHEPRYAHLDFGLGSDVHRRVWPEVLRLLHMYTGGPRGTTTS